MSQTNRQIWLVEVPRGKLSVDNFVLRTQPRPEPGPGQVLLRSRFISLDAANRAWMMGATYRAAVSAGSLMPGSGLAEVVHSNASTVAAGEFVVADIGWQEFAVLDGHTLRPIRDRAPTVDVLNVYGIPGLTAYVGLFEIGRPNAGDTVVISAAGGAVGSLAGQLAKIHGCRVIGITGGAAKSEALVRDLGFDAAIDYKSCNLRQALKEACPAGIDVYFDNVSGAVLEACLFNMAPHGRIVCCGATSQYDGEKPAAGPRGVPGLLVTKRLTMRGFIVFDHEDIKDHAIRQLQRWVGDGKLQPRTEIIAGLESLPAALVGLLAGDNLGKRVVKIDAAP